MRGKVVIIGAGHVGSHCAYSLCHSDLLRELVLIDIDGAKAQSHAIDLADTLAFMPSPAVVRTGDYEDLRDADIAVMAAGVPRPARADAAGCAGCFRRGCKGDCA